jgi:hypothetical protein
MRMLLPLVLASVVALAEPHTPLLPGQEPKNDALHVGFGEADITPKLGDKPVFIAGYGMNRRATRVHDPLFARAIVLRDGKTKIAIVSVDLVGFFHGNVLNVRKALPDFTYVLVTSTHNHDGPDVLGLWGPNPFQSGVDPAYVKHVEEQIAKAVKAADAAAAPAAAEIARVNLPDMVGDSRQPIVKHDELVVLRFTAAGAKPGRPLGLVVQWNCHPETMGSKNTEISSDYVGATVAYLTQKFRCPTMYITGTVGGLLSTGGVEVKDEQGQSLKEGTWEKTERYGIELAKRAEAALAKAESIRLTPLQAKSRAIFLPIENRLYLAARLIKVLDREGHFWTGNIYKADPAPADEKSKPLCIRTEIALLRLGSLDVICVPGEVYPELVLDKVQDPPDAGADFPDAPIEPAIYKQLTGPHKMIVGLANDEIGYIIPKRQWDEKPPFCYKRKTAQYGEINSLGPETAPLLCRAIQELARGK